MAPPERETASYRSSHQNCLDTLVKEFGTERGAEIRELYRTAQAAFETKARIFTYVPILTYRAVRQLLQKQDTLPHPERAAPEPRKYYEEPKSA